jgi:hypothetical protein
VRCTQQLWNIKARHGAAAAPVVEQGLAEQLLADTLNRDALRFRGTGQFCCRGEESFCDSIWQRTCRSGGMLERGVQGVVALDLAEIDR